MGLFGIMSYDEAMETLIEGTASKSVLEKAYKRIRKKRIRQKHRTKSSVLLFWRAIWVRYRKVGNICGGTDFRCCLGFSLQRGF